LLQAGILTFTMIKLITVIHSCGTAPDFLAIGKITGFSPGQKFDPIWADPPDNLN
jgi:hypothetical protein